MDFLTSHIEALIFCTTEPITIEDMQKCLSEMLATEVPNKDIEQSVEKLLHKYQRGDYAFQLYPIAQGYLFQTKPEYQASVANLLKFKSKKKLSKAALETLAIIAYKQPVTKTEVEQIRGVNCDYTFQRLLEKELISIKGKAESAGRPLLYATSQKFMEYFGINSIEELPQPKDFSPSNTEDEEKSHESANTENENTQE
ncbi:MAG: SMC-Scp complex subunit ScpB [Cytophagales bacterium]|nr:MAG: SMC-Scp complex subunit ScpB [Cytophagales bacterium]